MIVKACEHCGVEFDAESANAKDRRRGKLKRFCSRRCRNLSRPKLPERTPEFFQRHCGVCGLIFDATPSRPQYEQPRKYCRGCVREGRKSKLREFHSHCKITLQCESCKKSFDIPRRLVKSGKHAGRYCSLKCANIGKVGQAPAYIPTPHQPGTRKINKQGYIHLKIDHRGGWMLEHRYVMEQVLKRKLLKNESPHHLNGDRTDNRPENLELWVKPQPSGQRVSDLITYVVQYHREELLQALSNRPS